MSLTSTVPRSTRLRDLRLARASALAPAAGLAAVALALGACSSAPSSSSSSSSSPSVSTTAPGSVATGSQTGPSGSPAPGSSPSPATPSTAASGVPGSRPATSPAAGGSAPAAGPAAAPPAGTTVDGAAFGRSFVASLKAARSGRSTLSIATGGATSSFATEFSYAADGTLSTHATGTSPAGTTEVVAVGGTTYTRLPQPVGGRTWSRSADQQAALGSDPAAISSGFADSTVTYVGEQNGQRHYTLVSTGQGGGTIEAYLDASGRPIRLDGKATGLTLTATYGSWGAPVTVTPPPADQVVPS